MKIFNFASFACALLLIHIPAAAMWHVPTWSEALISASKKGDCASIKQALEFGGDANAKSKEHTHWTPLHHVACTDLADVALLLIKYEADVNIIDGYGRTPLHIAAESNAVSVGRILLEHGADPNIPDQLNALTPLHYALFHNALEFAALLLEFGALPNTRNEEQKTGFECLMGNHRVSKRNKLARLLIEHGADINTLDSKHRTPAKHAKQRRLKLMRLFLEYNAQVDVPKNKLKTIEHLFYDPRAYLHENIQKAFVMAAGRNKSNFVHEIIKDHRDCLTDAVILKALNRVVVAGHEVMLGLLFENLENKDSDSLNKLFLLAATTPKATVNMLEFLYKKASISSETLSMALCRAAVHLYRDKVQFILDKDFEQDLGVKLQQAGERIIQLLRNAQASMESVVDYMNMLTTLISYQRAIELEKSLGPELPEEIKKHIARSAISIFKGQASNDRCLLSAAARGRMQTVQDGITISGLRIDVLENILLQACVNKHPSIVKHILRSCFIKDIQLNVGKMIKTVRNILTESSCKDGHVIRYRSIINLLCEYVRLNIKKEEFSRNSYDLNSIPAEINMQLNQFILGGSATLKNN